LQESIFYSCQFGQLLGQTPSMTATMKIINAGSSSLDGLLKKIPELKLLLPRGTRPTLHPRLWLEDEAAAYAASRLLFAHPNGENVSLPLERAGGFHDMRGWEGGLGSILRVSTGFHAWKFTVTDQTSATNTSNHVNLVHGSSGRPVGRTPTPPILRDQFFDLEKVTSRRR